MTQPGRRLAWPRRRSRRAGPGQRVAIRRTAAKFYGDDPLAREPETQDASGSRRGTSTSFVDLAAEPVRASRRSDAERPRAGHQHDRRSARLELVHQSHRRAAGQRRRGRARPADRRPGRRPARWAVSRAKEAGAAPGFTMRDSQRRHLVRVVRRRRAIPKRRPARCWSRTRSSGRSATGRSRTS